MPCFLDSPFKVASEYRIERHVRSAHRRRTPSSYSYSYSYAGLSVSISSNIAAAVS